MAAKVTWTVTAQRQTQEFDANGNIINGKSVSFQTDTGYSGSVFVPNSVYADPAQVKDMIAAEVAAVASVHGLSGTVG